MVTQNKVLDEVDNPDDTIEVVGQQWSWTFNYTSDRDVTGGKVPYAAGTASKIRNLVWPVYEMIEFKSCPRRTSNSALQINVEPTMRGRVMSLYLIVFLGSTPIGAPLVGWLAEAAGPRAGLLAGGVAALLAGVAAWFAFARRSDAPVVHSRHGGRIRIPGRSRSLARR